MLKEIALAFDDDVREALDGALARRAVVARAVAVDAYGVGPQAKRLAALADAIDAAERALPDG